MRIRVFASALSCCFAIHASAEPANATETSTHEVAFASCRFQMKDFYNGDLTATKYSTPAAANYSVQIRPHSRHPFETSIQFSCENPATAKTYLDLAGIRRTDKGWALDPSPENIGLPQERTTFYPLHGKGWEGGGVTQDDINGDEKRRTRIFAFCIPHNQLALCGVARHVGYLMWPKETVLPQVLKLLESIEFIDTQASVQSSIK